MASNLIPSPDTATTLSVFSRPGEDVRLINSNSDSIFTFGDFRLYTSSPTDTLSSNTLNLRFDSFSTLDSLRTADFKPPQPYSVSPNELNLKASDPFSYAYFGSFYTEVVNAINDIINGFPYAILAYRGGTGITIYDYTQNFNTLTGEKTSSFKIPYSALTNQGNVVVNSATTVGTIGIASNFNEFAIQMSSTTSAQTSVISILGYTFSSNTIPYLEFTINDFLENVTASTSTLPIYIRPTKEKLAQYKLGLSELEYNMLYGFNLDVISVEDDITEISQSFVWPTTIDGFNPDTYGSSFETFKNSMLKAAADTDDAKTNILLKTVIPENYIELDSQQQVYASLVQTYAHQFDEIKRYIDGIAYAHTVTYNKEENVPDKFLKKLSTLLGWKLSDKFNELDLFEYLAGDADGQGNSYSYFNLEVWRRILINLTWLYKKKGTRDAIQFIFKVLGAPECLLKFDEFTYQIQASFPTFQSNSLIKADPDTGYINYQTSQYVFQEGGPGRGDGQNYIDQWRPEFDPQKQIDNIKVVVGDESVYGSANIINTKEVCLALDPAQAIECDVFNFYQQSGTCWMWGSVVPPFSSLTIPFEYAVEDCNDVQPENITGMTLSQYLDYVYTNLVDPRNRKVLGYTNTSFFYPQLRNAYLSYYYWTEPQSNRLTFHRLQPFLDLIEGSFTTYVMQLLPATTILECQGTTIRNTVFNRQKFVYKPGLNDGSEFRNTIVSYESNLTPTTLTPHINEQLQMSLNVATITPTVVQTIKASLNYVNFVGNVNINLISAGTQGYEVTGTIDGSSTLIGFTPPPILIV